MSYLHCPTCSRAYNVAREAACPSCGVRAGVPSDPTDAVVAAAEQLARAMARATPAELIVAQVRLGRQAAPSERARSLLGSIRAALAPASTSVVAHRPHQALLAGVVMALLTRIPKPKRVLGLRSAARALLGA